MYVINIQMFSIDLLFLHSFVHLMIHLCTVFVISEKGVAYVAVFGKFGQHNHDGGVVLPEHSPKVLYGLLHWSLSGNGRRSWARTPEIVP